MGGQERGQGWSSGVIRPQMQEELFAVWQGFFFQGNCESLKRHLALEDAEGQGYGINPGPD